MNTTSKLLCGLAAVAMLASCSSDEPAAGPDAPITGGDQKAYMAVRISSVGEGRSTDFNNPSYNFGNGNEHAVKSAKFFFFDENGNNVLEAKLAEPTFGNPDGSQDNVEWLSKQNVLVLEDLTGNAYPSYMLTVLNMPDFKAGETLALTEKKLSDYAANFYMNESNEDVTNFVMTTTSYLGENKNHDNKFYNLTKLDVNDFKLTVDEAQKTSPVDVYVERLAAKVQVKVGATAYKTIGDGRKIYKLDQTVAGDPNDHDNGNSTANSPVYIEVLGWGLNATANKSYMSKILDPSWDANGSTPFKEWNSETRFRSFWGVSQVWVNKNYDKDLNYTYYKDLAGKTINDDADYAQYCYENTNAAANIFSTNNAGQRLVETAKVTHVILKTRIVDEAGDPVNMINFRGTLFTQASFVNYVLNSLKNSADGLNYYYLVNKDDNNADYRQVNTSDVTFVGINNETGKVNMVLADPSANVYYKTVDTETGADKYVKYDNCDLQTRLTSVQGQTPLYWYNKGANIYYIPIEHNAIGDNKEVDGYYGVVRNHWYTISINSFSRVGHAIYDPDNGSEQLKPDHPEDPLYYVGARINVLSWRLVNQNVDL